MGSIGDGVAKKTLNLQPWHTREGCGQLLSSLLMVLVDGSPRLWGEGSHMIKPRAGLEPATIRSQSH